MWQDGQNLQFFGQSQYLASQSPLLPAGCGTIGLVSCAFEEKLCPAIRALCLAGLLDRQIHLGVGVPQVHSRHRTGQRNVVTPYTVTVLCVCRDQLLVNCACSFCHCRRRSRCGSGEFIAVLRKTQFLKCGGCRVAMLRVPNRYASSRSHICATNSRSSGNSSLPTSGGCSSSASRCRQSR